MSIGIAGAHEEKLDRKAYLWVLLPVAVTLSLGFFPVRTFDIWQHIASAREIVRLGTIPKTDLFLYTSEGRPWVNHSWGGQILYYLAYRAAEALFRGEGIPGLILMRMALGALGAGLFWVVAVRRGVQPWAAALMGAALMAVAAPRFIARPRMFAPALAAGMILCLLRPTWPRIAAALCIQILWANIHASFLLGIIVILAMALEALLVRKLQEANAFRRLLLCAPIALIVSLANPNTYQTLLYGWRLREATWVKELIVEWWPLDFSSFSNIRFLVFAVVVWGMVVVRFVKERKIGLADTLLLAFLTYLAFDAVRFICLWAFFAVPVAAVGLDSLLPKVRRPRLLVGALVGMVAAVVWAQEIGWTFRHRGFGFGVNTDAIPVRATTFMKQAGITGNVMCSLEAGGYLEWAHPECRPSADGRCLVNDPETMGALNMLTYNRPGWKKAFPSPGVSDVMLIRHTYLTPIHEMAEEWAVVYWDGTWEILLRRSGSYGHLLTDSDLTHSAPNILPHVYEDLSAAERKALEEHLLRRIEMDPGCGVAHALLAYVYYLWGVENLEECHSTEVQAREASEGGEQAEAEKLREKAGARKETAQRLFIRSIRLFQRDIELVLEESRSFYGIARNLVWLRHLSEAQPFFDSAAGIDPLNWVHARDSVAYYLTYLQATCSGNDPRIEETRGLLEWIGKRSKRNRKAILKRYARMHRQEEMPEWL